MIQNRIAVEDIIEDSAIEDIVSLSGGNLRQISMLIQEAVSEVLTNDENGKITQYDIQKAKELMASKFSFSFSGRIEFLHKIKNDNISDKGDNFKDSIIDNMIFAYLNGASWYETNPIIDDIIDLYYNRTKNND